MCMARVLSEILDLLSVHFLSQSLFLSLLFSERVQEEDLIFLQGTELITFGFANPVWPMKGLYGETVPSLLRSSHSSCLAA